MAAKGGPRPINHREDRDGDQPEQGADDEFQHVAEAGIQQFTVDTGHQHHSDTSTDYRCSPERHGLECFGYLITGTI